MLRRAPIRGQCAAQNTTVSRSSDEVNMFRSGAPGDWRPHLFCSLPKVVFAVRTPSFPTSRKYIYMCVLCAVSSCGRKIMPLRFLAGIARDTRGMAMKRRYEDLEVDAHFTLALMIERFLRSCTRAKLKKRNPYVARRVSGCLCVCL